MTRLYSVAAASLDTPVSHTWGRGAGSCTGTVGMRAVDDQQASARSVPVVLGDINLNHIMPRSIPDHQSVPSREMWTPMSATTALLDAR